MAKNSLQPSAVRLVPWNGRLVSVSERNAAWARLAPRSQKPKAVR